MKTLLKTLSWRLVGALDTFALSYLMTGKTAAAVGIVGFEVVTKMVWFYGHEKLWDCAWVASFFATTTMESSNVVS